MDKALLDTSTSLDVQKAAKHWRADWASNTLRNVLSYRRSHVRLTVSAFAVFESVDGVKRQGRSEGAEAFRVNELPSLEVIYPDEGITLLAAEIHASLQTARAMIGVVDTFIAATAIASNLTLVTANTKHFQRVRDAGFHISLFNWREPGPADLDQL